MRNRRRKAFLRCPHDPLDRQPLTPVRYVLTDRSVRDRFGPSRDSFGARFQETLTRTWGLEGPQTQPEEDSVLSDYLRGLQKKVFPVSDIRVFNESLNVVEKLRKLHLQMNFFLFLFFFLGCGVMTRRSEDPSSFNLRTVYSGRLRKILVWPP